MCTGTKKELEKTKADLTKNFDGLSTQIKGYLTLFQFFFNYIDLNPKTFLKINLIVTEKELAETKITTRNLSTELISKSCEY